MMLDSKERWLIATSVACFMLAGLSGAFFRFGMMGEPTFGFAFDNIRHAHSHLMYFSWATPALMVVLAPGDTWIRMNAWAGLVLGLLSFPFFLYVGYDVMNFAGVVLPPAAMISGIIMLTWYGFAARWLVLLRGQSTSVEGNTFQHMAIAFLICSSIGAWGISFALPLGLANPAWIESFKHLFLSYFTEGWLTLVCLAILSRRVGLRKGVASGVVAMLTAGISTSFILGMPSEFVSELMQWVAKAGALLTGLALSWIGILLWKNAQGWWKLPVAAILIKGASLTLIAPWPTIWWADRHLDRILFLHLLLLGIVSLTIVLSSVRMERKAIPFYLSVCLLIAFLLPVSSFWIFPSVALTWVYLIPVVSLLPVLASIGVFHDLIRS